MGLTNLLCWSSVSKWAAQASTSICCEKQKARTLEARSTVQLGTRQSKSEARESPALKEELG